MASIISRPIELELMKSGTSYVFRIPSGFVNTGLMKVGKKYKVGEISESDAAMGTYLSLSDFLTQKTAVTA